MSATFYILYSSAADKYYSVIQQKVWKSAFGISYQITQDLLEGIRIRVIVYSEEYAEKEEAYSREREVKKWKSRDWVEHLIAGSEHPS